MTTALLVIDVQQSFQQRPSWADIDLPDIADRCATLVASARHRNERVIWILHDEPGTNDVFDPATGYCTFIDGLRPLDEEPVLHKTAHNAFTTTSLARELTLGGWTPSASAASGLSSAAKRPRGSPLTWATPWSSSSMRRLPPR